jgi:hypothetical protein
MDEDCARNVVLRAYTICLLCVGQRLDGAAVHLIVLPQARRGNGRAGVGRTAIRGCRRCCVPRLNRQVYEFLRHWTIEQVIGYLYSTSLPLRRLLGDRQTAFEQAVADTLLAIDPAGHFTEPVALEVPTRAADDGQRTTDNGQRTSS